MTDSVLSGPAAPGRRLGGAGRWTGSLALVLAAHIAGGAALLTWRQPPGDQAAAPPAVMIDLTPLPEPAPAPPPPEPAPQPEPQPVPQPAPPPEPPPPEPIIEPPPIEAPPAPVPDAMVAVPVPTAKPKPPKPPPVHKVERRHRPPPDTVAKPAPTPPAPAPVPAAPTQTRTAAAVPPGVLRNWQSEVLARLERFKRYPRTAQARRQEGTPRVRFTIDRQGRLVSASLEHSSGVPALDAEALALLSRAAPLPAPPADMDADNLTLIVPIDFTIR